MSPSTHLLLGTFFVSRLLRYRLNLDFSELLSCLPRARFLVLLPGSCCWIEWFGRNCASRCPVSWFPALEAKSSSHASLEHQQKQFHSMYMTLYFLNEVVWLVTPIPPSPLEGSDFATEPCSSQGYCNIKRKLKQIPGRLVYP